MEKEVFEKLLNEFNELNKRITKCRAFLLDEEKSKVLDALNRDLLVAQLKNMESYIAILSVRIGLNAPKEEMVGFSQVLDSEAEVSTEEVND